MRTKESFYDSICMTLRSYEAMEDSEPQPEAFETQEDALDAMYSLLVEISLNWEEVITATEE